MDISLASARGKPEADSQIAREREWLEPSIALTFLSGAFGILMIPSYEGILPALSLLPLWMVLALLLGSIYGLVAMMVARVESPLASALDLFGRRRRTASFLIVALFLAGLNMTTFMWVKPLLNYLVPFWADPLLADLDWALFLGRDPWALLTGLNSAPGAIFYHRGWFVLMILTLIMVLTRPSSPEKSAVMLTYFVLWSIVGPVVHALVPAAGPIFFAQLGYGDRFAGLASVSETREVATYLWTLYSGAGFGPGSGISAMPSLHIATTAWMLIAVHSFARRWTTVMAAIGLLIFLLSVALGWHYASDGLVGGACALLCYRVLRAYFRKADVGREAAFAG
ncbi:phosphatase PAP2 family protein [Sphingosinicella sp. LY1275]|uniref:phosphatase PAP2 family protein n=1 Tax=Sphingosinicella sp. LY1275 TaxID=3095379 RepID=UPI002ADEE9BA|nr:phosphatase PAP2 family protein [Sphingosinicella sp. LY1275]MEA1015794.1 phosphatase PAP2 family protein [Sphingosinicella sp. LY1275]